MTALIVEDDDWSSTLEQIISFRRFLRKHFGIRMRDELKAGYLIHGTGPFRGIGEHIRNRIFGRALRLQHSMGTIQTWAIVVDKEKWEDQDRGDSEAMRTRAWQYMVNRIERFTSVTKDTCLIFPDEGHPDFVQKTFRQMRRFSFVPSALEAGTSLSRPATYILEDPNFRKSHESYFVQLADLNAYAAHRHMFPRDYFGSGYWEQLGDARYDKMHKFRSGPRGIVVLP